MWKRYITPPIPQRYIAGFRQAERSAARDSMLLAASLLAVCYCLESLTQLDAGNPAYWILPLVLCVLHAVQATALITGRLRPVHPELGNFLTVLSPFMLTTFHLVEGGPSPAIAGCLALELVGLCSFVPVGWFSLLGATAIACELAITILSLPGRHSDDVVAFLAPTLLLGFFAHIGRARALRQSYLREIDLQQANRKVRLTSVALEQASHYVMSLDSMGRINYANTALQHVLGKQASDTDASLLQLAGWSAETWRDLLGQLIRNGNATQLAELQAAQGVIPVKLQFDLFGNDVHAGICCVAVDLTDQRKMEQELQRVQQLDGISQLAVGVAHDYTNMLVPILANASLVQQQLMSSNQECQHARDIVEAAKRMSNIARELMMSLGDFSGGATWVDVGTETRFITNLLGSSLPQEVSFSIKIDNDVPRVKAARGQVCQVITNLVMNGGQAMEATGGQLDIEIGTVQLDASKASALIPRMDRPEGTYVHLLIRDEGCGMPAEVQERMFDPFFTNKPAGRGLGLPAVLNILRRQQAGIAVDSQPDEGTEVSVFWPVQSMSPPESTPPLTPAPPLTSSGSVMLVDDEPLVREAGKRILESQGYRVLIGADGDDAIALAGSQLSIDVAILDNVMPGPGLVELTQQLRKLRPDLKLIASSGRAEGIPEVLRSGAGRIQILPKPYDLFGLIEAVSQAVSAHSLDPNAAAPDERQAGKTEDCHCHQDPQRSCPPGSQP